MSVLDWEDSTTTEQRTVDYFIHGAKTLWRLCADQQRTIVWVLALTILLQGFELIVPLCSKVVFDLLPQVAANPAKLNTLWWVLAGTAGLAIAGLILRHFVRERIFNAAIIKLENHWPVAAQAHLLQLSMAFHERENTGRKIAKVTKGVDKMVDTLAALFWELLPQLCYLAVNAVIIAVLDWRLALVFMLPFIPVAWVSLRMYEHFSADWEAWDKAKEVATGFFCQSLINVATVQSYAQEGRENAQLGEVRHSMEVIDRSVSFRIQWWFFAIGLLLRAALIGAIAFGTWLVVTGRGTVGTVVYVIASGSATIQALQGLVHIYAKVMRNIVSVERMEQLLQQPIEVKSDPAAQSPAKVGGQFALHDVSFVYPGKTDPVVDRLSLKITPGEFIALVGKSGEGKTTLVRLLTRAYDVTSGQVTLDSRDIRRLPLDWYRRRFAIVAQDVDIFDGTLSSNVTYAHPEATAGEIAQALQAAHLADTIADIRRFPDGANTLVGERGVRLSGGERQRVGIARAYLALLNGASVLVLDEATSNLDSEAERAIQQMLQQLRAQRTITIIAIAHRLSTIRRADTICVLGGGGILERGSHADLLRQNGLYAHLVDLQQLGELHDDELAVAIA